MWEKLALSEDILMKVEKPERYIGHEVNSVVFLIINYSTNIL